MHQPLHHNRVAIRCIFGIPKRWAEAKDQDQDLSTPSDGEILRAHSVRFHHSVATCDLITRMKYYGNELKGFIGNKI